jgi:hypothetical protein
MDGKEIFKTEQVNLTNDGIELMLFEDGELSVFVFNNLGRNGEIVLTKTETQEMVDALNRSLALQQS